MIVYPNAKINIGLRILNKRSDGFHNIESIFYPVKWFDALELLPAHGKENQISMTTTGIEIPGNMDENLCIKAYHLINSNYALPALKVHLHKQIPIGAGLGGGSADAAFFIKALNEVTDINLSFGEMHHYAKQLGSDCSFFINNRPALALQKGEELEPVSLRLAGCYICIVYPGIHISTKEAYAKIIPAEQKYPLEELASNPIEQWKDTISNDFEKALLPAYPVIVELKEKLYANGAVYAAMSGSGSAVYGIFKEKAFLKDIFRDHIVFEGKLD